jgi:hypothetical protein
MSRLPRIRPASLAASGAGAAMLGFPLAFDPAAWPLTIAGAAALCWPGGTRHRPGAPRITVARNLRALFAALPGRWTATGTAAAAAAMGTGCIAIIADRMHLAAAVAEAMLVLTYLLALDLAESRLSSGALRWLRERAAVLAAGLGAAVLTAIAAGTTAPASPWLAAAGVIAAGAALLVAAA